MELIDRIDALVGVCQQCQNSLGTSPSRDFCSEDCQCAWHANRTRARSRLRKGDRVIYTHDVVGFLGTVTKVRTQRVTVLWDDGHYRQHEQDEVARAPWRS